jgi:hypothetical protein
MTNAFQNLHCNRYLFYNHYTTMINEYNNPYLIAWMFPTLFPFGIGVPKMNNKPIKLSLQTHVKHLMHSYKMWVQFISPCSLDQQIHYFFTGPHSLQPMNSLKIQWNHLAYTKIFICSDEFGWNSLLVFKTWFISIFCIQHNTM